jgi:uracil phosphoribosyltransferase
MNTIKTLTHPLITHKLALLRNKQTSSSKFRSTLNELSALMCYELTRDLATVSSKVETPLEQTSEQVLARPITLMPIMRAGMGMSDAVHKIIPEARIGHIGLFRNEETKLPEEYYFNAPSDIEASDVILIDPMLATGGSANFALDKLKERGISAIRFMCLIAAPEGIAAVVAKHPDVHIYTAAIDRELDKNAYIRPGLGDAGDRIFGTEG